MVSLERYVPSAFDAQVSRKVAHLVDNGFVVEGDMDSHIVCTSGRMREIAEAYLARGEYYDIDYPGGIEQLVRDYRAGVFDGN